MRRPLPVPLKATRVLLFVFAAAVALQIIGGLIIGGITPEVLALLVWVALPGAIALALALRLPSGRRPLLIAIAVFLSLLLLMALGRIGAGEPQGLINLLLPTAMLVLVFRRSSRTFLAS
ncbi:hypothetical protein J0910_30115 [Nocardiopsis sp. CNT-189]|uniref:hypothetical protein n=1 Tax=Nocardiopsis oceanisediminis TaxID=2816862 RepID=UPI003B2F0305